MSRQGIIPDQILLEIFQRAYYKDIVACRAVCRHWKTLISSSMRLIYLVWLGIHGKMDGDPGCSPNTSVERLELLLQHEEAWTFLCHRRLDTISPGWVIRERICGENTLEETYEAGSNFTTSSYHLPSAVTKVEVGERTTLVKNERESFGDSFQALADPDNALLVLISRAHDNDHIRLKFSLRSIQDPTLYHPHARIPILDYGDMVPRPPGHFPLDKFQRQVMGNLLISWTQTKPEINFLDPQNPLEGGITAIIIWDWTTGELLARLYLSNTPESSYYTPSLLSSTTFVIPELRLSPQRTLLSSCLKVYDFASNSNTAPNGYPTPQLVASFELPDFDSSSIVPPPGNATCRKTILEPRRRPCLHIQNQSKRLQLLHNRHTCKYAPGAKKL
ncbi:hypothetical protein DL93DRAFT_1222215 [Clavulina sp. PMI_390]|nr:hypothetical protein DL93DRAFT_1222215 [Clavulina sp. PMI_390]